MVISTISTRRVISTDPKPTETSLNHRRRFDSSLSSGAQPASVARQHGTDWLGVVSALALTAMPAFLLRRRTSTAIKAIRAPEANSGGLTLKVDGMSYQHCVTSVKKSLEGLNAVEEAAPNLSTRMVRVRGSHLDVCALVDAVEKAGFRVTGTTNT